MKCHKRIMNSTKYRWRCFLTRDYTVSYRYTLVVPFTDSDFNRFRFLRLFVCTAYNTVFANYLSFVTRINVRMIFSKIFSNITCTSVPPTWVIRVQIRTHASCVRKARGKAPFINSGLKLAKLVMVHNFANFGLFWIDPGLNSFCYHWVLRTRVSDMKPGSILGIGFKIWKFQINNHWDNWLGVRLTLT